MPWVDRCLGSLRQSTIAATTVVVDNGSTDGSIAYIKTHYPEVVVLEQKKNSGFGQGNNAGIRYALEHGCSHVLLLNQDAWIESDMPEKLLHYADTDSLLSPVHLNGKGVALDTNFKNNSVIRGGWQHLLHNDPLLDKTSGRYETREINAACWLLPASTIRMIGGFNPLFYHYGEDINYLHRLRYNHIPVYFVTSSYVYHDRENRKPAEVDYSKVYRELLLIYTNINHNTFTNHLKSVRYLAGLTHRALKSKKIHILRYYFSALNELRRKKSEITASRNKEKSTGTHWL